MSKEGNKQYPVMVSIECCVYNHAPYLRQCFDGFVMQKTNFPFEAIVHDDASTDESAAIIMEYAEKYPDIIKPIIETENQYSKRDNTLRKILDSHIRGKYIAWCEGDDYWVDPYKLQKQVDYMEQHHETGLCYMKCKVFYQNLNRYSKREWGGRAESFEELLFINTIPTATVMFREYYRELYYKEICPYEKKWKIGDYPLWLYISKNSKMHFINEVSAVYRLLEESASHSKSFDTNDGYIKSVFDMKYFYNDHYCLNYDFNDYKYKSLALNAIKYSRHDEAKEYLNKIQKKNALIYMLIVLSRHNFWFKIAASLYKMML